MNPRFFNLLALVSTALAAPAELSRPSSASNMHPGPGQPGGQVQSVNSTWPWQAYKSSSLTPPNLTITENGKELSPGYVLFAQKPLFSPTAVKMTGSFIMTQQNELVYGNNDSLGSNFRVQEYKGKKYLTSWEADSHSGGGVGYGYVSFLDTEYKQAFNVCVDLGLNTLPQPRPRCQIDSHEQLVSRRNTLVVTAQNYTQADLTSIGGPADGWVLDSQVHEVDVETGAVLFSWSSLAHVPVASTHQPLGSDGTKDSPLDWFHVNSVEMVGNDFLVNSRNCWTTYLVSGADGHIIWSFNTQDGGSFATPPPSANFSWQHHVRAHNVSDASITLSYFDNANSANSVQPNATKYPTRGLVFQLALPPSKTAAPPALLRDVRVPAHPESVGSQGLYDVDVHGSRNQFMAYGQISLMREYGPAPDGSDLRWEARFGADNQVSSYRAYKQQWHATPAAWDPALVVVVTVPTAAAAAAANGSTTYAAAGAKGYVSWNGATEVQCWRVYNGGSQSSLKEVGEVPVRGFETEFNVPAKGCVMVEAVMQNATRKSNVVCN